MASSEEREGLLPLTTEVEAILVANQRRFLGFLEGRVGSRAAAEELLQAAFVRAVERGVPVKDEEGAVSWFYAVLRNALVDHHRRTAMEGKALQQEADQGQVTTVDPELKSTVCACLRDLLPTLKPEYAEMVRQVDLEERSVREVAASAGLTATNASVRLHRARKALKAQLERSCGACAAHGCLDCSCRRRAGEVER